MNELALDAHGNAVLLWVQARRAERNLLQASVYLAQTYAWSQPETLCAAEIITNPRLALTESGQALAGWCQAEGLGASRLVVKARMEGRWEEGVECLELGREPVREFALDLRPDGLAGLLATQHGVGEDWASLRLRRATWSPGVRLLAPPARVCSGPQLRLWPDGATALWTQGVGRNRVLVLSETW